MLVALVAADAMEAKMSTFGSKFLAGLIGAAMLAALPAAALAQTGRDDLRETIDEPDTYYYEDDPDVYYDEPGVIYAPPVVVPPLYGAPYYGPRRARLSAPCRARLSPRAGLWRPGLWRGRCGRRGCALRSGLARRRAYAGRSGRESLKPASRSSAPCRM
jgi:hypothetical protein